MATGDLQIVRVGQLELRFLADDSSGVDSVVMFEYSIPPQARVPAPHYHRDVDEIVHATGGTLTFSLGGRRQQLQPGETIVIPRGQVHYFENLHDTPARGITTLTPGTISRRYFEEMADALNMPGRPDAQKVEALMLRYGLIPADAQQPVAHASLEDAIGGIIARLERAWNAHDAEAWAAEFLPDASLTNVFGIEIVGRDEIVRTHTHIMTTLFRDSRTEIAISSLRFVTPDVASVTARWKMWGAYDIQGNPWPERDGLMTLVIKRDGGTWRIDTFHNMDLPKQTTVQEFRQEIAAGRR